MITPAKAIAAGQRFKATVAYAGVPGDEQYVGYNSWHADEHEVVTMDEPHMSPWWFPANDHPTDKALMDISITVPRGNTVISNGEQVSRHSSGDRTTYRWRAAEPMATYLAFFAAGEFAVSRGTTDGIPWVNAVSQQGTPAERKGSRKMLAQTPGFVSWLASRLGDYPFAQAGGVVTSLDVGFSLETQTRPVYGFYVPEGSAPLSLPAGSPRTQNRPSAVSSRSQGRPRSEIPSRSSRTEARTSAPILHSTMARASRSTPRRPTRPVPGRPPAPRPGPVVDLPAEGRVSRSFCTARLRHPSPSSGARPRCRSLG